MYILKDLWYGNLAPADRAVRPGSEYYKQQKKISHCQELLNAELSESGKGTLEDLLDADSTANSIAECSSFLSGFRMGVLMMIDVFQCEGEITSLT